ncbi:sensor histidine kinase [Siphonobacter sp. SORGH_AS_0500]|uniref:sensor histidine kinase n=2 Tax=Siphonobacter sp. SORGH_AS_0500 TaxID=1864824 RepID=UPI0028637D7C|nr:sensor histidine kinase [Siphonobacter sp. SORGH_AS_0500]MDR6194012.1 signal transduction histidine kinase [Siphonobacter sp. SORGH_AS_0500]
MKKEASSIDSRIRTAALLEGQEEERKRLAQELHDGVGQLLTGIRLQIELLQNASYTDKEKISYQVLKELVLETIETVRQISYDLMPSVLTDFGLVSALRLLSEKITKISGIKVRFNSGEFPIRLSSAIEVNLYRIVQEAINNSLKYAKASVIDITLTEKKGKINLRIQDDGIGFNPEELAKKAIAHSGLGNMKLRAESIGSTFEISSIIGKGTTIKIELKV